MEREGWSRVEGAGEGGKITLTGGTPLPGPGMRIPTRVSFNGQPDEGNQSRERWPIGACGTEKSVKTPGFSNREGTGEFQGWGEGLNKGRCASHSSPCPPTSWHFPEGKMKLGKPSFDLFQQ